MTSVTAVASNEKSGLVMTSSSTVLPAPLFWDRERVRRQQAKRNRSRLQLVPPPRGEDDAIPIITEKAARQRNCMRARKSKRMKSLLGYDVNQEKDARIHNFDS